MVHSLVRRAPWASFGGASDSRWRRARPRDVFGKLCCLLNKVNSLVAVWFCDPNMLRRLIKHATSDAGQFRKSDSFRGRSVSPSTTDIS
jgi:hypothetical protein